MKLKEHSVNTVELSLERQRTSPTECCPSVFPVLLHWSVNIAFILRTLDVLRCTYGCRMKFRNFLLSQKFHRTKWLIASRIRLWCPYITRIKMRRTWCKIWPCCYSERRRKTICNLIVLYTGLAHRPRSPELKQMVLPCPCTYGESIIPQFICLSFSGRCF